MCQILARGILGVSKAYLFKAMVSKAVVSLELLSCQGLAADILCTSNPYFSGPGAACLVLESCQCLALCISKARSSDPLFEITF